MAVFALPAVLTHDQANACRQQLVQAMRGTTDRQLLIDASALQTFDSSAIAVLLACRRQALAQGQNLQFTGWPERLRELARLYGVHDGWLA